MYKILFFLFISIYKIYANTINFTETKYINALNMETSKKGVIEIEEKNIKLIYPKENKKFIFYEDKIISILDKEEELSYEDNIELEIFHILVKTIYSSNFDSLKEYFHIEKKEEFTKLIPNEYISNIIDKIEYSKEDDFLKSLKIYFTNKDRIKIVQVK